ncbi:hypothetical protein CTI12_AA531050 [Artemisia annua]|uniref:Helitron helicase-like domain-containing protein n=1 Tax=Artemisia annua TaxID=35608 RepID=A0A2U1L4K5_ARTAN|nr:hypothetical protein CTI12_AA531050 [Artemisia annua]
MDQNKQRNVRKRKKEVSSINKPQASNQILPLLETITPPSNKRVYLAELLTYDPVNSSLPSSHLPNTSSTQSEKLKGSFARSTGPQPKAPYRSPLADVTNRCPQTLNDVSNVGNSTRVSSLPFFQGTNLPLIQTNSSATNHVLATNSLGTFPTRLSPLTHTLTSLPSLQRTSKHPPYVSTKSTGGVSVMPHQQTTLDTSASTIELLRSLNSRNSDVSQRSVVCNTIANDKVSSISPNCFLTSAGQAASVAATRKRESPLNDISYGPVSITPQQPKNVGTTSSSNTLNRTPTFGTSICKKHIKIHYTPDFLLFIFVTSGWVVLPYLSSRSSGFLDREYERQNTTPEFRSQLGTNLPLIQTNSSATNHVLATNSLGTFPTRLSPLTHTLTSLLSLQRTSKHPPYVSTKSTGGVSVMPHQQTTLDTSASTIELLRSLNSRNSDVSQRSVVCNTIANDKVSSILPNCFLTSAGQAASVAATRKRESPLNDISYGPVSITPQQPKNVGTTSSSNTLNRTPTSGTSICPVSITPQQPKNVGTTSSSNTLNRTPNSGTSICPVSITPQQPKNVGTTSSSNTLNRTPNSGTSICPVSITSQQRKNVPTTSSSNMFNRSPTSGISILSQTPLPLNTVNNVNRGMTTRNSSLKSSTQSTPVVTTSQRNRSPLTDVSNVCFETPEVRQVHQRTYQRSTSGVKTSIPTIITRNSSYEVVSHQDDQKGLRDLLYNLQRRLGLILMTRMEMSEKYVTSTLVYPKTTTTMEMLHLSAKNVMHCYGKRNPEEGTKAIQQTKRIAYVVASENNSKSSSGSSNSKHPIDRNIINEVQGVLDTSSDLVQMFRRARDRYTKDIEQNIKIKLIAKRGKDGRNYNLPTANKVAGLIVGDFDSCAEQRYIVIDKHGEVLQRINIFHPMYLPLQYPLLMLRAQDGYHLNIPLIKKGSQTARDQTDNEPKKKTVTMRQWFSYQIMDRPNQENLFTRGGRLFQQFLVDRYTMVETERLYFHRAKQSKLSTEEKKNVALYYIEQLLRSRGTTLRHWPEMPYPDDTYISEFDNIDDPTYFQEKQSLLHYEGSLQHKWHLLDKFPGGGIWFS